MQGAAWLLMVAMDSCWGHMGPMWQHPELVEGELFGLSMPRRDSLRPGAVSGCRIGCVTEAVLGDILQIEEAEDRLKQQQKMYEAVRAERNTYSKNLIQAQDEMLDMKRKTKFLVRAPNPSNPQQLFPFVGR